MSITPYEYRKIPLHQVDVPKRRIRGERPERIEAMAKDIAVHGQLQPIIVVELEDGRFALDDGAVRVLAMRANKADDIDAHVTSIKWLAPEERTVRGLMANLNRADFTALEHCEALHTLKQAYEKLHPEAKKGGDKGNQHTGGKKRQTEIFSFSQTAAEALGLSERAIRLAVAIWTSLTFISKERLRDTPFERKQSDLKALSEVDGAIQSAALDLLLADPPEAMSVAEAISMAKGEKPDDPTEKVFASFSERWSRFQIREKRNFVRTYAADLVTLLKELDAI